MHRLMPWLNAALLGIAIYLGVAVWGQHGEKAQWQRESATRTARAAALRAKASEPSAQRRAGQPDDAQATPAEKVSQPLPPVAKPILTEAERNDALEIANREKQSSRRNTLNTYAAGFDALHLPPEKLARAKEILLIASEAAANARKAARSIEDFFAAVTPISQAKDEQMTALLGPDNYDSLKASTLVSSLDWTLGTDMWDGGAPLAPEQLQAIALVQVRNKFERPNWLTAPNVAQTPDPQTGLSSQDAALFAASAQFLSPTQQEIFRRSLIEENQYNAAMRAFSEKQRQLSKAAK